MPLRSLFHNWSRFSLVPPQLRWLYIAMLLQRMGESFLAVVGPIFLFQLAPKLPYISQIFPQDEIRTGFVFVITYYLFERLAVLFLAPFLSRLPISKNIRLTLTLGQAANLLIIIFFTLLEGNYWLFLFIPFLQAINLLWYWTSYYIFLASELDLDKMGQEMGAIEVLSKITPLVGPLFGVLLVPIVNFNGVFWLGSLFYFLSVLFLLVLPDLRVRTAWKWSDFWTVVRSADGRDQMIGLGGSVWEDLGIIVFWPLFLYIFFHENMISVDYLLTGATFISFIFIYLSGWIFDHRKHKSHWEMGSGSLLAGLWILRSLAFQFPLFTLFTEMLDKIVAGVFNTLFKSLVILRIRANNSIIYAYNRQISFAISGVVGYLSLYLVLFLNIHLGWMFLSFFVGGMLGLLFVKDRRLRYRLDK